MTTHVQGPHPTRPQDPMLPSWAPGPPLPPDPKPDNRWGPFTSKVAMVAYGAVGTAVLLLPTIGQDTVRTVESAGPQTTVTAPAPPQATVTVTAPAAELDRQRAELDQRAAELDQREQAIAAREAAVDAPQEEPAPPAAPAAAPAPVTGSAYYANCDAARAAGDTPLFEGDPGYRPALDRDNDGVACE
jgi:Excalibur calcium-binding domain